MSDEAFNLDQSIAIVGGRSPMVSGSYHFTAVEVVPTSFDMRVGSSFTPMKILARINQEPPKPVALHIRASAENSPFDFDGMANFPDLGGAGAIGFVLVIDYGDLSGRHRVCADFRSGTYELPAITFAQVGVLAWSQTGTLGFGIDAAATLSTSPVSKPKALTYTGAGLVAAAASVTVPVPYYAEWVDIWANGWAGGIGAASAPNLRGAEVGLYRDYTTGLFVPPWGPIALAGDALDTDVFTLENAGAAEVRCFAQFFLEL